MRPASDGRPTGRPRARPVLSKRGAALLLALSGVVVVGILASALGALVLAGIRSVRTASRDDVLLNVAESGVDLAISRLARDPAWRGGEAVCVPGGLCIVTVRSATGESFDITSSSILMSENVVRAASLTRFFCTVRVGIERTGPGSPAFSVTEWDAALFHRPTGQQGTNGVAVHGVAGRP